MVVHPPPCTLHLKLLKGELRIQGLGFNTWALMGWRVGRGLLKNNLYLEAYQYLGLGLLPIFRSMLVFRFRVATGIQKHPNVQVQGCHQYLEEKDIASFQVQGCYQYLETPQCLGLGLPPVFRRKGYLGLGLLP